MKVFSKGKVTLYNISNIHILSIVYGDGIVPYLKANAKDKDSKEWVEIILPLDVLIQEEI